MSSLVLLLLLTALASLVSGGGACSKNHHFDFVLLAIQWPQTFCSTTACVPHADRWQIHGAWPENDDATWPSNCCTNHPFDASLLESIEPELVASWKTLKKSGTNEKFWAHEYNKHGSCAHDAPLLNDVFKYFNNTLAAFREVHLEKWLTAAGIVPSTGRQYSARHFDHAIQVGLGHDAQLSCVNRKGGVSTISQVNICLDKITLKPIDCPLADRNCKTNIAYRPTH